MSVTITTKGDSTQVSPIARGGIAAQLQSSGRLPPVSIVMTPLDGSPAVSVDRFLTYTFNNSILIPVDTFSFTFVAPDDPRPFNQIIKEGDLITLFANGVPLATGIVDTTDVEVDSEFGERVLVSGRDLMGQMEDQDVVSINSDPIWANRVTLLQGAKKLIENTRVRSVKLTPNAPTKGYLLAAEPGESKIAALQRFLEGINCISFMDAVGNLIVGKPNMAQQKVGTLVLSKARRTSNVLSMKCIRQAALIPNVVVPIWAGQESTQSRIGKEQAIRNLAPGPKRLYDHGHRLPKAVVVSTPNANSPSDLSAINKIQTGAGNLLGMYALREIAKQNQREVIIQVVAPGHYNENGDPYRADTVYQIDFDRGDINEEMYLFQVEYSLTGEGSGQVSNLYFCRKGTIVADVKAQ